MATRRRQLLEAGLSLILLSAVVWLLKRELRDVDPAAVLAAARGLGPPAVAAACLFAGLAYSALAMFDLTATRQWNVPLSRTRTALTSLISYAFNFNLGAVVGAVAMRLKLYGRFGIGRAHVLQIMVFCIFTSWIGYLLLFGAVFAVAPPALPDRLATADDALRPFAAAALVAVAAYLALCGAWRRPLRLRQFVIELPPPRIALLQLALGSAYWLSAALSLYHLFPASAELDFVRILALYLIAAVAAVIAHLPAGLGVLEGTFVLMLAADVPKEEVLAALLAFRVVFYLAPLLLAAAAYAALEVTHHRATLS